MNILVSTINIMFHLHWLVSNIMVMLPNINNTHNMVTATHSVCRNATLLYITILIEISLSLTKYRIYLLSGCNSSILSLVSHHHPYLNKSLTTNTSDAVFVAHVGIENVSVVLARCRFNHSFCKRTR